MDASVARSGPEAAKRTRNLVFQVLALLLAVFVIEQDSELLLADTYRLPGAGTLGATLTAAPDFAPGYVAVSQVEPGGALARVGVQAGDHLRFDRVYDYLRPLWVGERAAYTLDHKGSRTHAAVAAAPDIASPRSARRDFMRIFLALTCLIVSIFGAYMVLRSGGRPMVLRLGLGLLTYGLALFYPQLWEAWPAAFVALTSIMLVAAFSVQTWAFQTFALDFVEETHGGHRDWARRWAIGYAVFAGLLAAAFDYAALTVTTLPVIGDGSVATGLMVYPPYLFTFYIMFEGWRRGGKEVQKRYGVLLIALALVIASQLVQSTAFFLAQASIANFQDSVPVAISQAFAGIVAPILFTYAIFRNKVLDLGFALNRTLVYGAVSAILLVAFGLIEWAVDHVVKIEGREKNALIDGAIALGVFLTFHRVRDFVEHHIETVFFRSWHDNEARLRRFVSEAPHMLKPDALTKAFIAELTRFGAGAPAALYEWDEADGYRRRAGAVAKVPPRLDADLTELVRLRADRKPIEPEDGQGLAAALILPMVHRNEVTGFVVLDSHPDGQGYRPDEIEVLDWATRQIGHDLYALRVDQLDRESHAQKAEIAQLRVRNEELRRFGPSPQSAG
jgi:hypothetical protein